MNKYQKVLKEAAQTNICGRIGCLIYDDFIFCFAPLEKNKRTKKINHLYKKKKNKCLWSDFAHRTAPVFFVSLLLSSSTFSHTNSVVIAQETRNTVTMLSLFL